MTIGAVAPSSYAYAPAEVTVYRTPPVNGVRGTRSLGAIGTVDSENPKTGKVDPSECQTCKERKYVDQSDESVSFKTPGHIDPKASAAVVRAHEQEHVANAVQEGNKPGNELVSSSVALHMAICPECGTPYVEGGTTSTTMRYDNDKNPYEQARKSLEGSVLIGQNVDLVA